MKCMIIQEIIGATGIVTKGVKKHLEAVPGKHSIESLQKTAVLGTSHNTEVLQSETWSLSGGDHRWFKRRCARDKRPVARDNEIIIIIIIIIIIKYTIFGSVSMAELLLVTCNRRVRIRSVLPNISWDLFHVFRRKQLASK